MQGAYALLQAWIGGCAPLNLVGETSVVSISLRAAKRRDAAFEDREIGPAERRLIDRLSEYGVLPPGRSPLGRSSRRQRAKASIGAMKVP